MNKRLKLTPKQQYIVDQMRDGREIVDCGGKYVLTFSTPLGDSDCPTCGHDIPREIVSKRTFDSMVKKGVLVPTTYWIANQYTVDGDMDILKDAVMKQMQKG